jgi:hypothetical protein
MEAILWVLSVISPLTLKLGWINLAEKLFYIDLEV